MDDDDLFHEIRRRIDEQIPYDPLPQHLDNAARAVLPLIEERERRAVRDALDDLHGTLIAHWDRTSTDGCALDVDRIIAAHRERAT